VAIEALGRTDLVRWSQQLSAAQATQAARRLEKIEAQRPSYAAIVTESKWENLSSLRSVVEGVARGKKPADWSSLFKNPAEQTQMRATSVRQMESNLAAAMDSSIARAKLPYSRRLPEVLQPADPLSAMLVASETSRRLVSQRLVYERNLADSRLLLVSLALQAAIKDKGSAPQNLGALVPKYLQAVPRDPFAPSAALRYALGGSGFSLYSVGPDGEDNGGAAIEGRGITMDSRGDIVAASPQAKSEGAATFRTVVPTSEQVGQTWKYTFAKPPANWQQKGFDDSKWQSGRGGFGSLGTPSTGQIGTLWKTPDIWMRRSFNPGAMSTEQIAKIGIRYYHDEDVEIYINGTQVHSVRGFAPSYLRLPLYFAARRAIVPGAQNVLAVHCHQTGGGQYVDVGLEQAVSAR
jgi:hypothetical protein